MAKLTKYIFGALALTSFLVGTTAAQPSDVAGSEITMVTPSQDFCINVMSGFPNDDMVARYQFFRLTKEMALDATPEFNAALDVYGDGAVDPQTPILDVLENIANPVLRQAAPEIVVASMDHLISFAQTCRPLLYGQISSLSAFDASFSDADSVIKEDALFLRQVLSDSLSRLGADSDPIHGTATQSYAQSLIYTRDAIEFAAFTTEIDDLESLYMVDLDGRLARSNDLINSEMDLEITDDSVMIAEDLNKDAKTKQKQETAQTLYRILNRY